MNREPTVVEWLETDHLGGYATGQSNLIPTRRYHALYISAAINGDARHVLLHHPVVEVGINGVWHPLSSFEFRDGTIHPNGKNFITSFSQNPWPRWTFDIESIQIQFELILLYRQPQGILRWTLLNQTVKNITLRIRPFLSFRDHHTLTNRTKQELVFSQHGTVTSWHSTDNGNSIAIETPASFHSAPEEYYGFTYREEADRGYDSSEDLFSPGYFLFSDLTSPALLQFSHSLSTPTTGNCSKRIENALTMEESRRMAFKNKRSHALSQFEISTHNRSSIIAGYPWFSEWGRDAFIALRGIASFQQDYAKVKKVLLSWGDTVCDGLIPNRFPDSGIVPEFNSVDATLWYLIVIGEFLALNGKLNSEVSEAEQAVLLTVSRTIFNHLKQGTRYHISLDDNDGLLRAGEPGKQLTWMDAKVGEWVVTPRIGKPIEIQALWINCLQLFGNHFTDLTPIAASAKETLKKRFWLPDLGYLADVIDVDHQPGTVDISLRPNQLLAIGGLPFSLFPREMNARILKIVEEELVTPMGLRTLSSRDTRYHGRYHGDHTTRDASYHQGTVWPWLIGPFIDAWLRHHGATRMNRSLARQRYLDPLLKYSEAHGGHINEIFDGNRPHSPRGAPFQAWSIAEVCRMEQLLEQQPGVIARFLSNLCGITRE